MKVAACQVPDVRDDLSEAVAIILNMASDAAANGADLVVFPECFLQGYFVDPLAAARIAISLESSEFGSVLQQLNVIHPTIVFGLIEKSGNDMFNTAAVVRGGKLLGRYRKSSLLEGERAAFSPGEDFPIFEVSNRKFGVNICYDLQFPKAIGQLITKGAELIVCPCNNMMPTAKAEQYKYRHNEIRARRSIESNAWLISADVTGSRDDRISYGPTAAINPLGEVVQQVPLSTTGMLIVDV